MTSGLTYLACFTGLCKFNFIVHTTCWKAAFCMDHEAKFTDWGKTSKISQAWSRMFLNLHHNSEHVDAVISGTGRQQEKRIFRFLNIHNKIAFYPNRKIFSQMFIAWNVGSDGKIKNFDDMGTVISFWQVVGNQWFVFVFDYYNNYECKKHQFKVLHCK